MYRNSSDDINDSALSEMHQGNKREEIAGNQPDIPVSPSPDNLALQPYSMRGQRKKHEMQIWASLLIVICLGSLGALSLAPTLFPGTIRLIVATGPASTPGKSTPVRTAIPLKEGGCTARPGDMQYAPGPTKNAGDSVPPPAWFQAGRSQGDLAYARACAASFVNAYQTFNANNPQTFEACVYMLTDRGKQRFYGSAPNGQPDKHMLPMWRASIQQQDVQQAVQASQPGFMAARSISGKLVAWMLVPYKLSISLAGSQPVVENAQMTVLLVAVSITTEETGWQVSQWQDGKILFEPSASL